MTNDQFDLKRRTKTFALRIIKMYCALPKRTESQVIGKQILRSGTSVGANYAEADNARSRAEFISKMGDSLKELSETKYWLELLTEADIVKPAKLDPLMNEARELTAIFATIIAKSRAREKQPLVIGH